MKKIWIVVASAIQASVYEMSERDRHLTLVHKLSHEESRMRNQDLVSDRPGHSAKGRDFAESISHKLLEAKHFAHDIAEVCEKGRLANAYSSMMVVAEPHFHGMLNKECSTHVQQLIKHHIAKDYTHYSQKKLEDQLKSAWEREIGGLLIS